MLKQRLKNSPVYLIIRPVMIRVRQLKRWLRPSQGARYDAQTLKVMSRVLGADSVCIDIGASEGAILKRILKAAPKGKHFAIEALPHLAEALRRNFPNVRVHGCALSDRTGETPFQFVKNRPAFSGLRRRTYKFGYPAEVEEIRVDMKRLDDIVPEDVQVDFIKIDIEGGEYDAMLGGEETINRCRPIIVFEAGNRSTAYYGVTPEMIHDLIVSKFALRLSTMERWLSDKAPFSREEFVAAYGKDFYFIAYPQEHRSGAAKRRRSPRLDTAPVASPG